MNRQLVDLTEAQAHLFHMRLACLDYPQLYDRLFSAWWYIERQREAVVRKVAKEAA